VGDEDITDPLGASMETSLAPSPEDRNDSTPMTPPSTAPVPIVNAVAWYRRFILGFALPWMVMHAVLGDPSARRRFLRASVGQSAAIIAMSVAAAMMGESATPGNGRWLSRGLAFWGAMWGAMTIAQWIVIAFCRDYHEATSREAALLSGVAPEHPFVTPRVRVNFPWMQRKIERRLRAFRLFVTGLPLIFVLALFVPRTGVVSSVLASVWGMYWLVVATAAKSARAWEATNPPSPWFLRIWDWLTQRVIGFRWWLPRVYGRLWRKYTAVMFSPAAAFEDQRWEFAGLALARAIGSLPVVKIFVRPMIPVASAHLLASRAARSNAFPEAAGHFTRSAVPSAPSMSNASPRGARSE
jgi:hypothetical protein